MAYSCSLQFHTRVVFYCSGFADVLFYSHCFVDCCDELLHIYLVLESSMSFILFQFIFALNIFLFEYLLNITIQIRSKSTWDIKYGINTEVNKFFFRNGEFFLTSNKNAIKLKKIFLHNFCPVTCRYSIIVTFCKLFYNKNEKKINKKKQQ